MPSLFGQRVEPDFDFAKEKRRDHVRWLLYAALVFCGVYLFSGGPLPTQVFQGLIATILPYGSSFYADPKNDLCGAAFLKAVAATLPIHAVYLFGIFYCDKTFPALMTKAIIFIPLLAIGFGIESALIFDRIIAYSKREGADVAPTTES